MPFTEYFTATALPALSTLDEGARRLLQGWGSMLDDLAQRARDSARAALVDLCEEDALGAHGVARDLPRARGEALPAYRAYLQSRFTRSRGAGTDEELLVQLARLGYPACEVVSWIDLALAGNPGAFGGYTSFWYLIIRKPNPWVPGEKWGARVAKYQDRKTMWGLAGGTPADLDEIRRIVRKWGPAGGSCRFIEIVLAQDLFGNPLKKVRVPVYEPWQRQSNGAYFDLYNLNY